MGMSISSVENTRVRSTSTVTEPLTTSKTAPIKQPKVDKTKAEAKNIAKENLEARVTELLDLKDNFIRTSVINKDGKVYLKLSRPQNDKTRSKERHDFSTSAIKSKLGLKDGVIKQHNNLKDITGRDLNEESGSATIEPGKSMLIPLSELGQNFSWYQFGRKNLVDYVNAYLECK